MPGSIFKKQQFKCIGCGKTVTAKVTVSPEQATDPIAPPPGWFRLDITAQHPDTGGIGTLVTFACKEQCAGLVVNGEGVGKAYIDRFKAAFAPGGLTAPAQEPAATPLADVEPTAACEP